MGAIEILGKLLLGALLVSCALCLLSCGLWAILGVLAA